MENKINGEKQIKIIKSIKIDYIGKIKKNRW